MLSLTKLIEYVSLAADLRWLIQILILVKQSYTSTKYPLHKMEIYDKPSVLKLRPVSRSSERFRWSCAIPKLSVGIGKLFTFLWIDDDLKLNKFHSCFQAWRSRRSGATWSTTRRWWRRGCSTRRRACTSASWSCRRRPRSTAAPARPSSPSRRHSLPSRYKWGKQHTTWTSNKAVYLLTNGSFTLVG